MERSVPVFIPVAWESVAASLAVIGRRERCVRNWREYRYASLNFAGAPLGEIELGGRCGD